MAMIGGAGGTAWQPRTVGVACALAATGLGLAYLMAAGAPVSRAAVNGAAFLIGLIALAGLGRAMPWIGRHAGAVLLAMGAALLATAVLGAAVDGAARWIMVGPLSVQVSLVLLPFMAVTFARYPTPTGCIGMAVAAAALALQPDRAMAGVLAASMAVLAVARPGRLAAGALVAAVVAFMVTLMRPDTLPAVPYVDGILFSAFDVHVLAGAAVWLGALVLLGPALAGWRRDPGAGHVYLVLGTFWLGCVAAAALGNYPTPVVGYGGSAILGYVLALAPLPPGEGSAAVHRTSDSPVAVG